MSKFKELCDAYTQFRTELGEVRSDAFDFSSKLVFNYVNYLGVSSREDYRLIPLDREEKSNMNYSPAGATQLGDHGFWRLGFLLKVYIGPNTHPQQHLIIKFKFCKDDSGAHLLAVEDLPAKTIVKDSNNPEQFKPVFDALHARMVSIIDEQTQFIHGKVGNLPSIGFIQGDVKENINTPDKK